MALYETVFIARQDVSAQDVDRLSEKFSKVVTDLKGKILKKEYWGLKNLAYILKKNRKGHYVMFGIDASAAAMDELKRQLSLNEDVIRNITLRVEEIDRSNPSIMLRSPGERTDSPERNEPVRQESRNEFSNAGV